MQSIAMEHAVGLQEPAGSQKHVLSALHASDVENLGYLTEQGIKRNGAPPIVTFDLRRVTAMPEKRAEGDDEEGEPARSKKDDAAIVESATVTRQLWHPPAPVNLIIGDGNVDGASLRTSVQLTK